MKNVAQIFEQNMGERFQKKKYRANAHSHDCYRSANTQHERAQTENATL